MAGFSVLAERAGLPSDARPLQLSSGVGFLGGALVVGRRGVTSGVLLAPERRGASALLGSDRVRR
ncbi:hypothetical protein [Kitasatospora cheerisanensis]|uniref:Uncharacterized protein n=1 Tax=Kitasatospora cheerisanensis KCTC 2395 TaxID=1348663 RepID=A0A066Z354_9ACTN|nr:hypothetical protein [Kitasatospora cheerisanensis]KDN87952.1 hypothetical protein KCH_02790 [Kitasatospora cheerisanensis KCTC 2395]